MFASEIILGSFAVESLAPIVVACVPGPSDPCAGERGRVVAGIR